MFFICTKHWKIWRKKKCQEKLWHWNRQSLIISSMNCYLHQCFYMLLPFWTTVFWFWYLYWSGFKPNTRALFVNVFWGVSFVFSLKFFFWRNIKVKMVFRSVLYLGCLVMCLFWEEKKKKTKNKFFNKWSLGYLQLKNDWTILCNIREGFQYGCWVNFSIPISN